jgi:uncharacterized membrane protein YoaK (UPF0700 family)
MTGNMTQLGIATTEIILAWRRLGRSRRDPAAVRDFKDVRSQLMLVLSIAVGFLVGAACGAVAFAVTGVGGALLSVAIVVSLALWAFYRERMA